MTGDILAFLVRLVTGVRTESDWTEDGRQRIYFANHSSHLDFIVIWAALPAAARSRVRPVAAAEYWERGTIRPWLAKEVFRAVPIPRTRARMKSENPLEIMMAALDDGADLIVFPEGTRSETGEVSPFKPGLFHLARRTHGIELVPVYLENLNRILPKGELVPVPLLGAVTFGPELAALSDNEPKSDFLQRAEQGLMALARPAFPSQPDPETE